MAQPPPDGERLVAEATWDLLLIELVAAQHRIAGADDAAHARIELVGFRVGYSIAEKASQERARFADTLDVVKFLCKDVWTSLFKKQVDNLKTNHRGIYAITDNTFRWLSRMSSDSLTVDALKTAVSDHLALPCGIIRGVLANFGIPAIVTAESSVLPQCAFMQDLLDPSFRSLLTIISMLFLDFTHRHFPNQIVKKPKLICSSQLTSIVNESVLVFKSLTDVSGLPTNQHLQMHVVTTAAARIRRPHSSLLAAARLCPQLHTAIYAHPSSLAAHKRICIAALSTSANVSASTFLRRKTPSVLHAAVAARPLGIRLRLLSSESTPKEQEGATGNALHLQVTQLQATLGESHSHWLERTASAPAHHEAPFRLTIVGDAGSGQADLATVLAGHPLGIDKFVADSNKIIKISNASSPDIDTTSSSSTIIVRSPSQWLSDNRCDMYLIPSSETADANPETVEDILIRSDAILLVSSVERHLTGVAERHIISDYIAKGKKNVFVVSINGDGPSSQGSAQSSASNILESRLVSMLVNSGSTYMNEPKLPPILTVSKSMQDTSAVRTALATLFSHVPQTKTATVQFLMWSAVQHLAQEHTNASALLADAQSTVKDVAKYIVRNEQRLVKQFRDMGLGSIQSAIIGLTDAIKSYFKRISAWKLFWRSDFIADDLRQRMHEHSLVQAEYQMTYATGKANEARFHINEHLIEQFEPYTLPSHPFSQHPITAALQEDIARLLAIARTQLAPSVSEIDPFLLRNEVASFDETQHCDHIQQQADIFTRRQLITQLSLLLSGLMAFHLGVPFAILAPGTVLVSGLFYGWMSIRWSFAQRHFLDRITDSQKTLKIRLTTTYENEFTRVIAAPVADSLRLLEDAIQKRSERAAAAASELESLARSIKST